jgi:RimJ/RimL family protein N-acetyltransferase
VRTLSGAVIAPDRQLAADGVVLRLANENDVSWIAEAYTDPDIARFIVGAPPPRGWGSSTEIQLVITDVAREAPLGVVSLRIAEGDSGLAAVGYWLRPEARGRGTATVAVRLVARWAFGELGVQRLELTTAPENIASQRVAERVGFVREGVLRRLTAATKDNGRRDAVLYSLLPADLLG